MRVLLIDAVEWAPVYNSGDSLRSVPRWFQRHFADFSGLEWAVYSPASSQEVPKLSGFDGVIMSGSPRDAWGEDPVNAQLMELIDSCRQATIPFLGVCYGHQLLARLLGAPVGRHPAGLQLGPVTMELTEAGRGDPLFTGLEKSFEALSGHADYVAEVPPDSILLATSPVTAVQGFRSGEKMYGVQFHPEMNADILRYLWQARVEDWSSRVPFDLGARVASIYDTPEATRVLVNFVEQIL